MSLAGVEQEMSKRLEKLLEKREKLNAQIQKVRTRQTAQERKEDTRRKILLGALVKEMMEKGELDEKVMMKRLEGFLTRDIDKKLFGFSVKEDKKGEEKSKGEIAENKQANPQGASQRNKRI